jgi:hypothetical protein
MLSFSAVTETLSLKNIRFHVKRQSKIKEISESDKLDNASGCGKVGGDVIGLFMGRMGAAAMVTTLKLRS